MLAEHLSHRYRFSQWKSNEFPVQDTDIGLETNEFCNHFGYNGVLVLSQEGEGAPEQGPSLLEPRVFL